MENKSLSPEQIYENRILTSKKKMHRECRADEDHNDALKAVWMAGYKIGKRESSMNAEPDTLREFFQ